MADNCKGCGAETFAGQRFCRMCGRPTGDLADEHAPTQNMPPPDQGPYPGWQGGRQGPAATAPAQHPGTAPVYPAQQQPVYYQGAGYPAYPPQQANSGFKWGWVFAFIGIGLFGTIVFAILLVAARVKRHMPPMAPPPPIPNVQQAGDMTMDETTGVVTTTQTVITQTFPLRPGASLSVKNTNGRIHVESWDGPGVEVKVTKSGGNEGTRRRVPIYQQVSGNKLSLHTGDARSTNIDVAYDIRVPKQMGNLDIASMNGSVKMDGVTGDINVSSMDGSIELSGINGSTSAKNMNGSISAVFDDVTSEKPMTFSNANGSIRLQFRSDVNADLKASTVSGSINLDPEWGIEVKKGFPIGARAEGLMGAGGPPLKVDAINGSISITKAPGSAGH